MRGGGTRWSPWALRRRLARAEAKHREAIAYYQHKLAAARGLADQRAEQLGTLRSQTSEIEHLAKIRARRVAQLEAALQAVPRYELGSLCPTKASWSDRWRSGRPRVLLVAPKDFAGSSFGWASAVNGYTEWAARHVTFYGHGFGYETDISYGAETLVPDDFNKLLEEADVVHIKDEKGLLDRVGQKNTNVLSESRASVFTLYGGIARANQGEEAFRARVRSAQAVVAITPDLCFDWLSDISYIPHAVESEAFPISWSDGYRVSHSPSMRSRKGTGDFLAAVEMLRNEVPISVDIIEGVSNSECLERKSKSTVFFDQAGREGAATVGSEKVIGWYGNSAVEAAVRGIPTIAHLSDEAFAGARRAGRHSLRGDISIINTPLGSGGIAETLGWYFRLSGAEREILSKDTRRWVEEFHDSRIIGPQLAEVYADVGC